MTDCMSWHAKRSVSPFLHDYTGLSFYEEPKTWIAALQHCRKKNATLVQISNNTVDNEVTSLLQNHQQNEAWIGLERSIFACNATWKWISGDSVQPDKWNTSTVPNSVNKYCGKIIRVKNTTYRWSDADCFEKLPYICQGTVLVWAQFVHSIVLFFYLRLTLSL